MKPESTSHTTLGQDSRKCLLTKALCTTEGLCHMLEKWDIILCLYLLCLQPVITLDGSISYTFPNEGMHTITVQVAAANTILQDTKTIAVKGQYICFLIVSWSS